MSTQGKVRVYKRENKKGISWTYCIEAGRNPATGKRRRVTKSGFNTAKEARAAAQPILNKLLLGENIVESDITFGEYAKEWLNEKQENVKLGTAINLTSVIKCANRYFEHIRIKNITKYMYQQFINDNAKIKKRTTVISQHMVIKNIFCHANKYNIIRTNPATDIVIPNIIINQKDIKDMYLTKNELKEVLSCIKRDAIKPQTKSIYVACAIMAFTGVRIGEACALLWSDVNFDNKTIAINSSLYGSSPANCIRHDTPKNQASIRTIKIGDTLIRILKEWKHQQLELKLQCTTREKLNFVLTRYQHGKETPVVQNIINGFFQRLNKQHVLKKHIHCHLFRHTHVSLLAEAGVPLEVIQERLGHSTDITTRRIYLHITEKQKESAANIFEEYIHAK